jgi:hypothetical protein
VIDEMTRRPTLLAGLLALGMIGGGCSAAPAGPVPVAASPSTSPTPSPAVTLTADEKLQASVPTGKSPIYRWTIKSSGDPRYGVVDPPHQMLEMSHVQHFTHPTHTETTTILETSSKAWVRVTFQPASVAKDATVPLKWMFLDPKVFEASGGQAMIYHPEVDMTGAYDTFNAIVSATETSPNHFSGYTSLSNLVEDEIVTDDQLKAMGAKAAHAAFTATVDSQGRLATMTLHLPAYGKVKTSTYEAIYDQYGTAAVPKVPTAKEQTKAPSDVYDWYR